MISQIKLENWKSFSSATLHIDPITVLIGTNASGKSNALDALLFLQRVSTGSSLSAALAGDGFQGALRGGMEWAVLRPHDTFAIGVVCRVNESLEYHYRIECVIRGNACELVSEQLDRQRYRLGRDGQRGKPAGHVQLICTDASDPAQATLVARLYNGKQGTRRSLGRSMAVLFQLFGQELNQDVEAGVSCVAGDVKGIFVLDPIPSHMRGYVPLAEGLEPDGSNMAGVLAALPKVEQKKVEKTLTSYATRLPERDIRKVYAETVGKFKSDAMLYCNEAWQEGSEVTSVDARGMSDGTLRLLAILTALLTRPEHSLLVIEEVDNGLHPSRAKLLLSMLREVGELRHVDVLLTTHNPALLDAMGPGMVPFITLVHRHAKTGNSQLTLLEDLADLPKLLSQGPVGQLSVRGVLEISLRQQSATDGALQ